MYPGTGRANLKINVQVLRHVCGTHVPKIIIHHTLEDRYRLTDCTLHVMWYTRCVLCVHLSTTSTRYVTCTTGSPRTVPCILYSVVFCVFLGKKYFC